MTDTSELDRLLVDNLKDLDDAAKRIDALGDRLWQQVCDACEEWIRAHGWRDVSNSDEPRIAPVEWFNEDEAEGWFYFDFGPDDTGNGTGSSPYFWLSRYVGAGGGQLCLWLGQEALGARKWKPIAREFAHLLSPFGFHLSDSGNFYANCTLSPDRVAAALADNQLELAMEPIEQVLKRAADAVPVFSRLLTKARTN